MANDTQIPDMPLDEARAITLIAIDEYLDLLSGFRAKVEAADDLTALKFMSVFTASVTDEDDMPCAIGISMPAHMVARVTSEIMRMNPAIAYEAFTDVFSDPEFSAPLIRMMRSDMEQAMALVDANKDEDKSDLATTKAEGTA